MKTVLKVLTPATCQDLTVLAAAKAHVGVAPGDTSLDLQIDGWIKRASSAIAGRCDRVFGREEVKQTVYLSRDVEHLIAARYPVSESPAPVVRCDDQIVLAGDYTFDPQNGLFFPLAGCWAGQKYEMTYWGGYNLLPELPHVLEQACLYMVALYYSSSGRDPLAKRIEIPGVETIDYWVGSMSSASAGPGALPPDVESLIAPFRAYHL